jgi:hypothetical protein
MYTISSQSRFISSGGSYFFLRDAPKTHTTKQILERYLVDAYCVFSEKLHGLTDFNKSMKEQDEKHLTVMLQLMIDARNSWEDESR